MSAIPDICVVRPRVELHRHTDAWQSDGHHELTLTADVRVRVMLDRDGLVDLITAAWERLSDADRRMIQREVNRRELARVTYGIEEIVGAAPRKDLRSVGDGA